MALLLHDHHRSAALILRSLPLEFFAKMDQFGLSLVSFGFKKENGGYRMDRLNKVFTNQKMAGSKVGAQGGSGNLFRDPR